MTNRAAWMTSLMMVVGTLTSVLPATAADAAATAVAITTPRRIIVSIADRRLVVVENNEVMAAFAVAVGAPASPSPVGSFTVINRVANPTYYEKGGKTIAPGPRNPVGTRWIGLSQKGYGIHGTDAPKLDRLREVPRLHPPPQRRCRAALRAGARGRQRRAPPRAHS